MPLPENFVDGSVFDAADINATNTLVNVLSTKVQTPEFNELFVHGPTYTVLASDAGKILLTGGPSVTLVIPEDPTLLFPNGTQIVVSNLLGLVTYTITQGGPLVFFIGKGINYQTSVALGPLGTCTLLKLPYANNWLVVGDVT